MCPGSSEKKLTPILSPLGNLVILIISLSINLKLRLNCKGNLFTRINT